MGHAVGDVLDLAAGVAVSPPPIVAIILVPATPRGRVNGTLSSLGWMLGLAVQAAVAMSRADCNPISRWRTRRLRKAAIPLTAATIASSLNAIALSMQPKMRNMAASRTKALSPVRRVPRKDSSGAATKAVAA
ncbi:hypothetical protein [Streptomyces sp. NPDC001070]